MPTVNSKKIINEIVSHDGYYMDDPRVMRIVKYTNAWGGICYGIEYEGKVGTYRESEYVLNPRIYWEAKQ